ncbi:MAG: DUF1963 domain-containing protein [Candidatus Rifleibacteriota bacterium]
MFEKIRELLKPLIRPCFKVTARAENFSPNDAAKTRIGGPAYAAKGQSFPVCQSCSKKLTFVFQFRQMPDSNSGELVQFFYCFDCSPWGGKNEEGQWMIKTFKEVTDCSFVDSSDPEHQITPCKCSFEKINMLPDYETLEEMGHEAVKLCGKVNADDPWDVYEEACLSLRCCVEPVTSIGGYPIWIQGEAEKKCPKCSEKMNFVAQLDSVPEADLMWGDAGCVYLFRCRNHPDQFSLEMQCF